MSDNGALQKGKMSARKWDWSVVGKAWSVLNQITNKFRQLIEKTDCGIDWAFLEWLATEAPEKLYSDLLGNAINAWQASMSAERIQKRADSLEYMMTISTATQAQADEWRRHLVGDGWRISSFADLARLRHQGVDIPCAVFWSRENVEPMSPVCFTGQHILAVNMPRDDKCYTICVREKRFKCSGDPSFHKCEFRKCPHRLPHKEFDNCKQRVLNNERGWCSAPGTRSMITRGEDDGALVTCVPV